MERRKQKGDTIEDMPNLEEFVAGPVHEPLPTSELILRPVDWWRCYRLGWVSGRYNGEMTTPWAGRFFLDLRVDIDPRYRNSPIMNKISGDLYEIYRFMSRERGRKWQVYRESWIVDEPKIKWNRCNVRIIGKIRFWGVSIQKHPSR